MPGEMPGVMPGVWLEMLIICRRVVEYTNGFTEVVSWTLSIYVAWLKERRTARRQRGFLYREPGRTLCTTRLK